jgi:hypothetical protein
VWIDVANSPHVLFFEPVIGELRRRGLAVRVTARAFAQTVELARCLPVPVVVIGEHGGSGLTGKACTLWSRVVALRKWATEHAPAMALGHASYAVVAAARMAGIPCATAMDFEHQPANHLAFRLADLVVVPSAFPLDLLCRQGATPRKTWRFDGLKEHISLAGFQPDPGFRAELDVPLDTPLVVVRPPADMALYHRFANPLLETVLQRLRSEDEVRSIVLPRTSQQAEALCDAGFEDLVWSGPVLDGRNLVAAADLVVSAGGSMNREAAVLGTPAYSVFAGRLAAVDRALVADGRLRLLQNGDDVSSMALVTKVSSQAAPVGQGLLRAYVDRVLQLVRA